MSLSIDQVEMRDRGTIAPCGIICAGCDIFTGESHDSIQKVIEVIEGMNIADTAFLFGLDPDDVLTTVETLKNFFALRVQSQGCPGCFRREKEKQCAIARCAKARGHWTCAECENFNPDASAPCGHHDAGPNITLLASCSKMSAAIRRRYGSNNIQNLKRCMEIGYPAFIAEAKEQVKNGWRTWQVISKDMVFTEAMKNEQK